jgi:hypothetical protein
MSTLAALSTTVAAAGSRFSAIPTGFWVRAAVFVAALVVLVMVLRKVAKMNKVLLAALLFVGGTIIGFNWIYDRNEPDWATPVVDPLAHFFPSRGKVAQHR